ncbi:cell wall hydrolase [Paracoccus versutus]|uniref:Cell wall hydrolase n=2 Tax=Paracoccaceae TaxID=31989 RepID=A0A099FPW8_PARVE|nr:cell wall hydrolase [Paracoccus versutus]MBT0779839.1 cell wall hydrolase [Paracoccus sp. pheM1]WGR61077.1 cell wall hydrolase [Paracoccus ferrooxidans]SFX25438.1 Cell Wall Hydrolase [Paracoccus pantotrophus]RDD72993.1 cell wall hydrolase [Paracoccus versutus]
MSISKSWLARVSVCVAVALSPVATTPAMADGKHQVAYETKSGRATRQATVQINPADLQCLSEALYFEARGEGVQGQQAVAEVILNRVDHPRFPKTVCGVVNQRGQFTYNKNARIREKGTYARVQRVAMAALAGAPRTLTNGATYFHARGVSPSWSKRFERTIRIGSHTFYRSDRRLASN